MGSLRWTLRAALATAFASGSFFVACSPGETSHGGSASAGAAGEPDGGRGGSTVAGAAGGASAVAGASGGSGSGGGGAGSNVAGTAGGAIAGQSGASGRGAGGAAGSAPGNVGGNPSLPPLTASGPAAAQPDPRYADVVPAKDVAAYEEVPLSGVTVGYLSGLVWLADKQVLLIADVGKGKIYQLKEPHDVTEWGSFDSRPSGLALGGPGTLVTCDAGKHQISQIDLATKKQTTVIDNGFGEPQDLVTAADGTVYFSVPGQPQSFIYKVTSGRTLSTVATYDWGSAVYLSLDQRSLYAPADYMGHAIVKIPVGADGKTGSVEAWAHPGREHGQGMCTDNFKPDGTRMPYLFEGVKDGVNCAFGGPDGKTLYLSRPGTLLRVRVNVPGLPQ
jgi:sugar lactone lactonase YvrE